MKKLFIKLSVCVFVATLAIASCKKSSPASTSSKLTGSWKLHQEVLDANANNNLDATDSTFTVDSFNFVITFNSNGTGSQSQSGVHQGSFTWTVNGNYIVTTDSGSTTGNGLLIVSGPGTTLTVADTSQHPREWDVLNKQ